jgi:hypothetical protein
VLPTGLPGPLLTPESHRDPVEVEVDVDEVEVESSFNPIIVLIFNISSRYVMIVAFILFVFIVIMVTFYVNEFIVFG